MALDFEHRRAFLACQGNSRLAVFNLVTHKTITTLPLALGSDVVQFGPGLRRIYVGCSSGAISVFQEDDPDHFRKLADIPVSAACTVSQLMSEPTVCTRPNKKKDGHGVARMLIFEATANAQK